MFNNNIYRMIYTNTDINHININFIRKIYIVLVIFKLYESK